MKMDEKKIILYPSNWFYNAGVIGFLKILDVKKVENSIVKIEMVSLNPEEIFNKWDELTREKLGISYSNRGGGTMTYYYSNQTEKSIKEKIEALLKSVNTRKKKFTLSCNFCGEKESTNKSDLKKKILMQTFGNILLASAKTFSNAYWMLKPREFVCSKCEFILMCHHIPFISLEKNKLEEIEIFINAPDFKLIWDLNRFAEEILKESKEYEIRKILGSSLLQWAIKRRALLGAWTMMNIEVIVKKRVRRNNKFENIIDYFDLPQDITKILLDYEIASLIERINEEKIFDLILSGKFSELEKANYFVLRAILKLKNKEKISENDPIKKYFTNNELKYFQEVSRILPELYAKILKKLEVNMEEKEKINELMWKLKKEGERVKKGLVQSINDIGFRLLEQVRLGNKDNVFYILLRCFAANEEKFPDELVEAFKPENEKYFKTLIFSFLAPILGKEETKGGEV
jgi:CRISPR-associated protein Cst1